MNACVVKLWAQNENSRHTCDTYEDTYEDTSENTYENTHEDTVGHTIP
jgi:hypothetical protein